MLGQDGFGVELHALQRRPTPGQGAPSNPMISPSSARATTSSVSGMVAGSMASEW